jgi:hypothetical protein
MFRKRRQPPESTNTGQEAKPSRSRLERWIEKLEERVAPRSKYHYNNGNHGVSDNGNHFGQYKHY